MLGFVTYLVKVDRDKWTVFRTRLKDSGITIKWAFENFIDRVIEHGPDKPAQKDKES